MQRSTSSGVGQRAERGMARGWTHFAMALVVAALTFGLGSAAADNPTPLGDPNNPDSIGGNARQDTDVTPVAKDGGQLWSQVAGAKFGDDFAPDTSVTAFSDELDAVAFRNIREGFAGGSEEIDCPGGGVRVPVIYRYTDTHDRGLVWVASFKGDCDHPGFVGAIAFDNASGVAIAVGGSGSYPKREPAYGQDSAGKPCPTDGAGTSKPWGADCDQAGTGRAWGFDPVSATWHELEVPSDMGGQTAIAFAASPQHDLGFSGGLGQLWEWENGTVVKRFDMNSPAEDFVNAKRLVFRVRQIRFPPAYDPPIAFAVTDGCCAGVDPTKGPQAGQRTALGRLDDAPVLLSYASAQGPGQWRAVSLDPATSTLTDGGLGAVPLNLLPSAPAKDEATRPDVRQDLPDSFYSFTFASVGGGPNTYANVSVVASPGGPRDGGLPERASVVTQPYCINTGGAANNGFLVGETQFDVPDQLVEATRIDLSTARLVSGDGDVARSFAAQGAGTSGLRGSPSELSVDGFPCGTAIATDSADAVPDWVVGELRSTEKPGLGAQALALSTTLRPALAPDTVNESPSQADLTSGSYRPTDPDKLQAYLRSQYFLLPSYALNAVAVIDPTNKGWAVGDHGAIVHLGGDASGGLGSKVNEAPPPKLGQRSLAAAPPAGAFDAFRPLTPGEPAPVPPLSGRPLEHLAEGRLVPAGSPDPTRPTNFGGGEEDVDQIVMSRDGGEGWAIGPNRELHRINPAMTTLYHYDGAEWTRCDTDGVKGILPPDPACASLASLRAYTQNGGSEKPVGILSAARVPFENDSDPANDDDFELVAVGTIYRERESDPELRILLTYHDGRWSIDQDQNARALLGGVNGYKGTGDPRDIVFTAPDDGWILGQQDMPTKLLHFDGKSWLDCTPTIGTGNPSDPLRQTPAPQVCDDPQGVLQFLQASGDNDVVNGMVTARKRVYLYGAREVSGKSYPFIVYHDHGGAWSAADGGLDPAFAARQAGTTPPDSERGAAASLAVAGDGGGRFHGWAVGTFGIGDVSAPAAPGLNERPLARSTAGTTLLRLADRTSWSPFADTGPLHDYLAPALIDGTLIGGLGVVRASTYDRLQLALPGGSDAPAFIAQAGINDFNQDGSGRLFSFDASLGVWRLLPPGRPGVPGGREDGWLDGRVQALAPDAQGGFWAAIKGQNDGLAYGHVDFFHYTDHPHEPVFSEAPSPLRDAGQSFTSLAGASDGTVWVATRSDVLYRFDRLLGWDQVRVPGWDPGRVVTNPSAVSALAVAPDGVGVAVGEGGRIADLGTNSVRLDDAAGTACDLSAVVAPCGTSRDLRAAAVAPDGSAIVGGDRLSLLWRPAGEGFRAIERPDAPPSATVSGLSMPVPGRAWLATNFGSVYAGTVDASGRWNWQLEDLTGSGDLLALDELRRPLALRAIAVDAQGQGFAVGDKGLVLERSGEAEHPWRRLRTPFLDDFTAVSLPAIGEAGGLVGGANGIVLTWADGRFQLARPADRFSHYGAESGPIVGLALVPGARPGETEAWAATRNVDSASSAAPDDQINGTPRLYHYESDAHDPLLNPEMRVRPLPDTPAPRPGEIAFAAFGKTDCHLSNEQICTEMNLADEDYQVLLRRVVDEIKARTGRPGGPAFAVFTGDTVDTTSTPGSGAAERNADLGNVGAVSPYLSGARKERRWKEAVADRLRDAGIPLYAAIGGHDLSDVPACTTQASCAPTRDTLKSGVNVDWRTVFADRPAPWGTAPAPRASGGLSFAPVADPTAHTPAGDRPAQLGVDDQTLDDPTGLTPGGHLSVPLGEARTHYAFDLVDEAGQHVARFVFVDTSLHSLAVGDPFQRPLELSGGQTAWLQSMLCELGSGDGCTRGANEQAIVVSNAPTYSYVQTDPSELETDASTFEALLFKYKANLVISGHLGWNGLYWATAPGVHEPCPGGAYQTDPPAAESRVCGQSTNVGGLPDSARVTARVTRALSGLGAPAPPAPVEGTLGGLGRGGILPFVVAAGAGGKFGDDGSGTVAQGFWHGYTIVRLASDGDPREMIVEQRPVFDWITLRAPAHTVSPGQQLRLIGVGREPVGSSSSGTAADVTRFDQIDSLAITHRYDLLEADPVRPYLPKVDPASSEPNHYVEIDPSVATVDSQTGQVVTSRGNHGRVYAIAELSVGDKAASWPLVFEPKRSYVAPRPQIVAPPPVPQIRVLGLSAQAFQAPPSAPPPSVPPSLNPNLTLPSPPALPTFPNAMAPPIAPPAPPTPPPPPGAQQAIPLNLSVTPVGISIPPTPGVTAQPTPPVQPAPPSGARREAKQRQAATAKSEEGGTPEAQGMGGDLADRPPTSETPMTRRDRVRAEPGSLLARPRAHSQPSAWVTGLEWSGGIGVLAFTLALGWVTVRPTPRRRPAVPAQAWSRVGR